MSKKDIYEFCVLESHSGYIDEKTKKLQSEGWELSGDVCVKYHGHPTDAAFVYIPFKRIKGRIIAYRNTE